MATPASTLPYTRLSALEEQFKAHVHSPQAHPEIAGGGGGGGAGTISAQDEGGTVFTRSKLNVIGAGATLADNPGADRLDLTVPSASATTFPRPSLIVVYSNDFPSVLKTTADATWTYQCDGVSDEVEINAAITQAALTRGDIRLMGLLFKQRAPILRKTGVDIGGLGMNSTRIEVDTTGWAGTEQFAFADVNVHATSLHDLWLDGKNIGSVTGVMGDNTGGSFTGSPSTSPDPSHQVYNLRCYNHPGHGVWSKANERGSTYHHIYVLGSGAEGVLFESPDCDISFIQVGSAGTVGFKMTGSNNRLSHIKAWFSDSHGIQNAGVRNNWTDIEAQDNLGNGLYISTGKCSFAGVQADSNSYDGSPSGSITGRTFYGIELAAVSGVILQAAEAYDKNEGGRGARQVYGFRFSGSGDHCIVDGITYGNFTGSVGGTVPGTTVTRILSVDGV